MIFCKKCGKPLPDDAKFCDNCGAEVEHSAPVQPTSGGDSPPIFNPKPKRSRWVIPVVILVIAAFFILIAFFVGRDSGSRVSKPVSSSSRISNPITETQYMFYENNAAHFSFEYPDTYELTEPNSNNVMIVGDEGDFQIMAEYAYAMPNDVFIYNAEDFAEIISSDETMLAGWLGIDTGEITAVSSEKGGCKIELNLEINARPYRGVCYVYDTKGNYGCYVLQFIFCDEPALKYNYQEHIEHVIDSFRITGKPEEDYEIHYIEEFKCTFAAKHEAIAMQNMAKWGELSLYPISEAYSDGFITISNLEGSSNFGEAMSAATHYVLENNEVISVTETAHLPLGRYDYLEQDLIYKLGLKEFTEHDIVFPRSDTYWKIQMNCTEENGDLCWNLLIDILVSLRFEKDGYLKSDTSSASEGDDPAPSGSSIGINEVLDQIESRPGFRSSSDYEPLACYVDLDKDGDHEFIAAYQSKEGDKFTVQYEVWSFPENGNPSQVDAGELYTEAGSMRGSISLVLNKNNGQLHLAMETSHFEGDKKIEIRAYIPWKNGALDWEEGTQMRCSLPMDGGKDEYYINERVVPIEDYNDFAANFSDSQTIDLQAGHGNGGEVAEFDMIRQWYGN